MQHPIQESKGVRLMEKTTSNLFTLCKGLVKASLVKDASSDAERLHSLKIVKYASCLTATSNLKWKALFLSVFTYHQLKVLQNTEAWERRTFLSGAERQNIHGYVKE